MKKIRLLTAIIFSILMVFVIMSCEKDDPQIVDPPIVLVPTFSVEAEVIGVGGTVTPTYVEADSGSTVSLNIHADAGYDLDSLIVNDSNVTDDINKSLSVNSYDITLNSNYQAKVTFKKNQLGYLTEKPWTLVSWTISGDDGYYWKPDLTKGDSVFIYTATFNTNHKVKSYLLNGNTWWNDSYQLTSDSLFIGVNGLKYKIVELTEEKMVLKSLIGYGDETGTLGYRNSIEVFEHK